MEAIEGAILAAGRGERLRARGPDLPKPLVLLETETLLARQARILFEAGTERVVAVINSETARLIERGATAMPSRLTIVVRDTPNSMETLFELGQHLTSRRFLAATVDTVLGPGEMARFAERGMGMIGGAPGAEGVLGVVRWRGDARPLFVEVEGSGTIRTIGASKAALVTAGVYLLPKSIFEFRQRARDAGFSALRQFLGGLLEWGMRLQAVELKEVIDIDQTQDLEAARALLTKGPNQGRSGTR